MITKFGTWEIDEKFGLFSKVNPTHKYKIAKERLWETTEYKGQIVWDWLIHLAEKTWITTSNFNDLVAAFLFAQDFFQSSKPADTENVSNAQTIYIAQQIIELREKSEDGESELDLSSEEALRKLEEAFDNESKIKTLKIN
jgi:hypothetical protein